jgi:hypothetical protein
MESGVGEEGEQGSEEAVSKIQVFWQKLRGPSADVWGNCRRSVQNRELKSGLS